MHYAGISVDWGVIGATLARKSSIEQAQFFKGLIKELLAVCGSNYAAEKQLAFVNSELLESERDLLGMLGHKE